MKGDSSLIWAALVILAVGVFVGVQQGWIDLGLGASALPGWTTLSLDKVEFDSNNPLFNGPAWVLTVVQGGLGQTAQLYASPSQLDSEKGLDLLIEYSEQTCNYAIVPLDDTPTQINNIYTLDLHEWSCAAIDSVTVLANCPDYILASKYADKNMCFCIDTSQQTSVVSLPTQIQAPFVRTIADISVSNGASADTFRMDTSGSVSDWINSDVFVSWVGYVGSGKPCLSKANIFAFNRFVNNEFRWYTGSYQYYDAYKEALDMLLGVSSDPDSSWINSRVAAVNDNANSAMNSIIWGYNGHIDDRTSLDNAIIVNEVDGAVEFPLYVFKIDENYLVRIHQPTSDISIGQVTCSDFQTLGQVYAVVNNIGDESVNVNCWIECGQFAQTSGNGVKSIGVGSSRTWTIGISASVTQQTTDTCVFHAQTADASVHKTKSFTAIANPHLPGCTEGEQRCSQDKIQECNSAGGWVDMTDCVASGKICQYNIYTAIPECVDENVPPPPECEWWDIVCHLQNLWNWIAGGITGFLANIGILAILAVVGFIVFMLITRRT